MTQPKSPKIIELPVEEFPTLSHFTKAKVVKIREPLYKDYRLARRVYPTPQQGKMVGYTEAELCLAIQLEGTPLPVEGLNNSDQIKPKDAIRKLEPFSLADRLFLTRQFTSLFLGDEEDEQSATEYARSLLVLPPQEFYTIPKEQFPIPQFDLKILRPNSMLQMSCSRRFPGVEAAGVELDEYIIAHTFYQVNGEPIQDKISPTDPPAVMDEFYPANINYLRVFFTVLFALDQQGTAKAIEQGKRLRSQLLEPSASTSPQKGTTETTKI
jgi:hypothetical protein